MLTFFLSPILPLIFSNPWWKQQNVGTQLCAPERWGRGRRKKRPEEKGSDMGARYSLQQRAHIKWGWVRNTSAPVSWDFNVYWKTFFQIKNNNHIFHKMFQNLSLITLSYSFPIHTNTMQHFFLTFSLGPFFFGLR